MGRLAFCGDDCNLCPRYTATQSGDLKQLHMLAEVWYRVGWRDAIMLPEEMVCHVCSTQNLCRHGIRECASETGVENCGQCRNYPCDRLSAAFERMREYESRCKEVCSTEVFENLRKECFSRKENLDRANKEYLPGRKLNLTFRG